MQLYEAQCLASLMLKEDLTSKTKFAKKIGYARSYLYELEQKELTLDFIETLEYKLNIKLTSKSASSELHTRNDGAESIYWEKCNDFGEFTKSPKLRTLWGDKEVIKGFWYTQSKNIRCIKVFDDRMVTPDGLMQEGAIVALDVSQTDYTNGGVFLYSATINNFKILRMARITVLPFEGVVQFNFNNSEKYPPTQYTQEGLKQANFKVHAKVLHDATHLIK